MRFCSCSVIVSVLVLVLQAEALRGLCWLPSLQCHGKCDLSTVDDALWAKHVRSTVWTVLAVLHAPSAHKYDRNAQGIRTLAYTMAL